MLNDPEKEKFNSDKQRLTAFLLRNDDLVNWLMQLLDPRDLTALTSMCRFYTTIIALTKPERAEARLIEGSVETVSTLFTGIISKVLQPVLDDVTKSPDEWFGPIPMSDEVNKQKIDIYKAVRTISLPTVIIQIFGNAIINALRNNEVLDSKKIRELLIESEKFANRFDPDLTKAKERMNPFKVEELWGEMELMLGSRNSLVDIIKLLGSQNPVEEVKPEEVDILDKFKTLIS